MYDLHHTCSHWGRSQSKPTSGNPSLSESNPHTLPSPTVQLWELHKHGGVLGPVHTVLIALSSVTLHGQLAVRNAQHNKTFWYTCLHLQFGWNTNTSIPLPGINIVPMGKMLTVLLFKLFLTVSGNSKGALTVSRL